MNIEILNYTQNPLTTIGTNASYCYNTKLKDENHARRIAEHCIRSGHGRNLEFADLTIKISGISARMGRELYTHVIGTTKVQSSTRYIIYKDFGYYTPSELKDEGLEVYINCMKAIQDAKGKLNELGYSNDVTGYILPLSMETTIVIKLNARALEHLANMRMCNRALKEFRLFMNKLKNQVKLLDEEWEWLANKLMIAKCEKYGFCDEDYCCGRFPKKEVIQDQLKY